MEERIKELLNLKDYKNVKEVLNELNVQDLAELYDEFNTKDLATIFRLLNKECEVELFALLDVDTAAELLKFLSDKEVINLIDNLPADDATDILEEMPANIVDKILKKCKSDTRSDINKLLNYAEDSAGSIMTVEYPEFKENITVNQAIKNLKKYKDEYETINTSYVVDKNRILIGSVNLEDLLFESGNCKIKNICDKNVIYANTSDDQEMVASMFKKYDINIMPVVDSEKRLVGIITIDDVVDVLEEEATEDMKKMAAIVPIDKPYTKVGVLDTFKSRIPWLLLLMVSATFTGAIITHFEDALAKYTILTAFIPMLMDTGGNAGGQASVSIIRAISLEDIEFKDMFKVVFKEFRVSILCSIVLAVCNFIKMLIIDRLSIIVALTVCITLAITVIIAKLIGCTLPLIAKKIGFDPAVMASPFITTIVDACSLLIYFQVASMILGL